MVKCGSKLNVLLKKVSQLGQQKDWKTALMLLYITYMIIVSQQSYRFVVLLHTSSSKFSDNVSIYNIYVVKQNIEC